MLILACVIAASVGMFFLYDYMKSAPSSQKFTIARKMIITEPRQGTPEPKLELQDSTGSTFHYDVTKEQFDAFKEGDSVTVWFRIGQLTNVWYGTHVDPITKNKKS